MGDLRTIDVRPRGEYLSPAVRELGEISEISLGRTELEARLLVEELVAEMTSA